MSKLTQLLLAAAVLVALILLAYEMLLGQAGHGVMLDAKGNSRLGGDGCSAWALPHHNDFTGGLKTFCSLRVYPNAASPFAAGAYSAKSHAPGIAPPRF